MKLSINASRLALRLCVVACGTCFALPGVSPEAMFAAPSYRYRMTVTVETPEGPRSGSSVVEVTEERPTGLARELRGMLSVSGEAVAVDLGRRGQLFVLLKDGSRRASFSSQAGMIIPAIFPDTAQDGAAERFERYRREPLQARLSAEQLPAMVRFRDPQDPSTVEPVSAHDLEATFGSGVRLRNVVVETTRAPVTREIGQHLQWLALERERQDPLLKGRFWDYRDQGYKRSQRLSPSDFSVGS